MKNNIYTKYSIERKEEFKIKTCIYEENGLKWVEKNAENEKSIAHIKKLNSNYKKLSAIFDKDVLVNECVDKGDKLSFQFVSGQTLEEMMDGCLQKNNYDEIVNMMKTYYQKIICSLPVAEKNITKEFVDVFGNVEAIDINYVSPSPIDIIFSNVIINDKWNIIDYEWTFDFPVPANFILYRAVVDYLYRSNKRTVLWGKKILEELGIDEKQQLIFKRMDQHFHEYVNGDCVSLGLMSQRFNHDKYDLLSLQNKFVPGRIQVFFDYGDGFSEDKSKFINCLSNSDECYVVDIDIPSNVQSIRIDPADRECIVKINKFQYDGCDCNYIDNGIELDNKLKLYQTEDPQWVINDLKSEKNFHIEFCIEDISPKMSNILRDYISINNKKHSIAQDKIAKQLDEIKRLNNINEDLYAQNEKTCDEIDELKNQMLSKDNIINEMQHSLSWRITKGLRSAGSVFNNLEK
jgi:hypothetical protein